MRSRGVRVKGRRVRAEAAYRCRKLGLRIVQKIRYCGEDAPDLCEGCHFREPPFPSRETTDPDRPTGD